MGSFGCTISFFYFSFFLGFISYTPPPSRLEDLDFIMGRLFSPSFIPPAVGLFLSLTVKHIPFRNL